MKKFLLIISLSLILFSCTKKDDITPPPVQQVSTNPSVASVTWSPVYEAGNFHPRFVVQLSIPDSDAVKVVNLRCVNNNTICWYVNKPKTGTYIMYNHVGLYPDWVNQIFYQFEFEMADGNKILLEKFQVY